MALDYFGLLSYPKSYSVAQHSSLAILPSGIGTIFFLTIFSFSDHPLSSLGLVVPKHASATAGFEILLPACLAQTTSSFWRSAWTTAHCVDHAYMPWKSLTALMFSWAGLPAQLNKLGLFKLGHIVTQGFNATVLKHRRACMCVFLNVYSVMWFSMLYLTQGINLVSRAWLVINFYSSAHSALALTTSNYVAGRSCHHKESHTFGWYDSLPLYYTKGHTEEDSVVSLTRTFWETIQTFNMKRMHGCKVGKLNTKDNFGFKHHIIRSMNKKKKMIFCCCCLDSFWGFHE